MPSTSASLLRFLRRLHLYFGVFIAPAILFFAFTGALQTAGLNDPQNYNGKAYTPPHWLSVIAQVHKKQTPDLPVRKPKPAAPAPEAAAKPDAHKSDAPKLDTPKPDAPKPDTKPASAPPPAQKYHIPMKLFFMLVCLGLVTSTLSGIYMAYKYNSNKVAVTVLLLLGIVVPLVSLPF